MNTPMKKLFFALLILGASLTPVFATHAHASSFWETILNLFRKSTPALERTISPAPAPIDAPSPSPAPIPAKAPTKVVHPTSVPTLSVPTPPVSTSTPVEISSEVETTTATTTESVATSTASTVYELSPQPSFLSPGSISFIVSSPASSAKSGTLTVYPGTRVTLWWEVPTSAQACTNSWGYPFISANNNRKTGTDVFPEVTTIYSISCTNQDHEIIDAESVTVEVVPLTGASMGRIPILTLWGLFESLFTGMKDL